MPHCVPAAGIGRSRSTFSMDQGSNPCYGLFTKLDWRDVFGLSNLSFFYLLKIMEQRLLKFHVRKKKRLVYKSMTLEGRLWSNRILSPANLNPNQIEAWRANSWSIFYFRIPIKIFPKGKSLKYIIFEAFSIFLSKSK